MTFRVDGLFSRADFKTGASSLFIRLIGKRLLTLTIDSAICCISISTIVC